MSKKEWFAVLLIFVVFLVLRIPGAHEPYHQDEYKWVQYSHPEIVPPGTVPHPPLTEAIYTKIGPLVGDDNFRFIPLSFSVFNFFLLFYLVRNIFGVRAAFASIILFTISFYSVLASLMVDVDGSVMPFFFLLSLVGYYKLRGSNFELRNVNIKWWVLLGIGVLGGFLIKVVFVLQMAALALDFAIEKGVFSDKKRLLKHASFGLLGILVLVLVLVLSKYVFPFFNLSYAVKYWKHFVVWGGRGWLQTFIQFAKAVMYLSPLLVLPGLFVDKDTFRKARPLFLFVILGLLFYLAAFDFSLGALDRYFQFLVLPLTVIAGAVFAKVWSSNVDKISRPDVVAVTLVSIGIFALQFFEQFVPPLYPKSEWLSRLVSFKWNFLFPFTGGSGPLPFYVSFQFIALFWIVSTVFVALASINRKVAKKSLFAVIIFGLVYNALFIEEYMAGKINGNTSRLVTNSVEFIENNSDVERVIVYNDNGGWEIKRLGKYARRMYATPQFEGTYEKFLSDFQGHMLYINIPRIYDHNLYWQYIDSCSVVFQEEIRYLTAQVLDCTK